MDKATAEKRFQESNRLFRNKQYDASLKLLDELDTFFPNNRRIRFAKAKCYGAMGRTNHAVDICEELINNYNYERAAQLKEELLRPSAPLVPEFELDLNPAFNEPAVLEDEGAKFPWLQIGGLALLAVVALLLIYAGVRMFL